MIKKKIISKIRFISLLAATFIILAAIVFWQIKSRTPVPIITPAPTPTPSIFYDDFRLIIPVLDINAPIISDVDGGNQKAYDKALEDGLAQLQGSSLPGEGSNIFIFGHSSFYWYKPGNYKTIFAKLPDIKAGDKIILWYKEKEHTYKVTDLKTVLPNDANVTARTDAEQLSLMTCVPVGSNQKRLIVIAKPE